MDSFFTLLGRTVLDRWKAENFSPVRFPDIAVAAFAESPPAQHVDVAALIRDFLLDDAQPFQTQSGFGEPELVVFDDPRFYIQLLFWLDGSTDIHQHEFSGAFHVLAGSSLHSQFEFENAESISAHLRVGRLRMIETRLLETGSTVPIVAGRTHIHSLFHLDTPSISVVIRTHTDPGTGPQFTYLPPHLAVDPLHNDALTNRRKQLLDVLERTGDPEYFELVAGMLRDLDFERGFFILQNGVGHLQSLGCWDECLGIFREKHGRLADRAASTIVEIVRRDGLVELRRSITEVGHRFFLALLLNVPARQDILDMVAQRFPGSPVDTIMGWIEELTETFDDGTRILDAEFQLALPIEDQPEAIFSALRGFLEGSDAIPVPPDDLREIRDALLGSSLRAFLPPRARGS